MKKIYKRLLAATLLTGTLASSTAFAAPEPPVYDPDNGYLISTERIDHADGGYTIEKIYLNRSPIFDTLQTYNTDVFRKTMAKYTAKDTLVLTCAVTATFDWSLDSRITRAYHVTGEVTYNKSGKISNEAFTIEGNETEKSNVNYRFTRQTQSGAKEDYLVSLACDQQGFN